MNELVVKSGIVTMQGILNFFIGGDAAEMIDELVDTYMDKDMSNDEKRKAVKAKVMPFVRTVGKELVSLAIAMAVTALRLQIESMQKTGDTNGN